MRTAKRIELILQLKYFNTSTSKWILTILGVLKEFERNGGEVKVEWYYYKDDTDMRDDIKDYILGSNLKIDMKPFVE
ncbi:MAG: SiaC family regulatory phosphoprotein [Bacteroidales bacterium]|nr:SiaC family regulatory phosphoprotein [Bacteroidales bacterium]